MAVSQNGWAVYDSQSNLHSIKYITGRVRPGDVAVIFEWLCENFDTRVEPIRKDWSWGWAKRPIRGFSTISNHASATAIDVNAPKHPLGAVNTFSKAQVQVINLLMKELNGVVRWGGKYRGRKDEMHFEIVGNAVQVKKAADAIRAGNAPKEKPMRMNEVIAVDADGTKVTVRMALTRGNWAYTSQLGDGYTASRFKKLEAPVKDYDGKNVSLHTAAQRGAHAYGAIFSKGWLGKAMNALRERLAKLERK